MIRYAVVTHACWLRPCRSSPMVRMAVPTTVWSRAERNMPAMRPKITKRIWRWLMTAVLGVDWADADVAASDMDPRTFCWNCCEARERGTPDGGLAVVGIVEWSAGEEHRP